MRKSGSILIRWASRDVASLRQPIETIGCPSCSSASMTMWAAHQSESGIVVAGKKASVMRRGPIGYIIPMPIMLIGLTNN
jgi:hypothetical protein